MKRRLFGLGVLLFLLVPGAVRAAALDPLLGAYDGYWTTPDGKKGRIIAQVRPVAKGAYDGFIALYRAKALVAVMKLAAPDGSGKFTGSPAASGGGDLLPPIEGVCAIKNGALTGSFKGDLGEGSLDAALVTRTPPSLGAKPPEGALVMFDGKPNDQWENLKWKITPEGTLVVGGGDIFAKAKFASFQLHVEFRTPFMPNELGQARGNSGVYLQSKFEVQVLDSFGLYPLQNNDCAGIYQVRAPDMNACLPPGEWQTYDITFTQGAKTRATVVHNGIAVIENVEIPARLLDAGTGGGDKDRGFLKLQDHGNPVEYRNIWVAPLTAADGK